MRKILSTLIVAFLLLNFADAKCDKEKPFSNIDGSCNNLCEADWGASKNEFLRMCKPSAEDCRTSTRRSAQDICDDLIEIHENDNDDGTYSAFLTFFGQFLDHDITLTSHPERDCKGHATETDVNVCNIASCNQTDQCPIVKTNSDDTKTCFPFTRSQKVKRDQQNEITSYIDLSNVYGSDPSRRDQLRSFQDGKLKVSKVNETDAGCNTLPEDECHPGQFFAGDVRANENPVLVAFHSLFVFEHNKIADELAARYPNCQEKEYENRKDEIIFEVARAINIAQIQHIIKSEYLTELGININYEGYDDTCNSGIFQEFSTAAYRFGHSGVKNKLNFGADKDKEIDMELRNLFFNTQPYRDLCLEGILAPQWRVPSEVIDNKFAKSIGEKLFIPTSDTTSFQSLCALNVQRGRDHKLGSYSCLIKECYGLNIHDFDGLQEAGFVSNTTRHKLETAYQNDFSKVDIFVAGLNEEKLVASHRMGATFHCILEKQFNNLIHGDRFYFENCDASDENCQQRANEIKTKRKMSDILCRNMKQTGGIPVIKNSVFKQPGTTDDQDGTKNCNNVQNLSLGFWMDQHLPEIQCTPPNGDGQGNGQGVGQGGGQGGGPEGGQGGGPEGGQGGGPEGGQGGGPEGGQGGGQGGGK